MMSMTREPFPLIDKLVAELVPVAPLTRARGLLRAGLAALATILVAVFAIGVRPDLRAGEVDPVFLLASGLFLILGYSATYGVIQLSRPHVGNRQSGWLWASAMAALLPTSAVVTLAMSRLGGEAGSLDGEGWQCLVMGTILGLLVAAVLILWLRRGAPTSPGRAGLLTGIAAGSFGIFAFGLYCPQNDIVHIGLWHGAAVLVSALIGRWTVPALIRW